jgi:hypothetical protein
MRLTTFFAFLIILFTVPNAQCQLFNFNVSWPGYIPGNPSSMQICNGNTLTITADTLPAGYTYAWYKESDINCNLQIESAFAWDTCQITVSESNTYYCYALDSNGQQAGLGSPLVRIMNTDDSRGICAANSTTICAGENVLLRTSSSSWDVNVIWQLNGVDIPGSNYFMYYASVGGTYRVKFLTWCDTTYSNDIVVTVNSPVASITGTTTFCLGSCGTVTATGGTTFLWSTGQITPAITICNAGVYTVTVTNNSGCTDTASVVINTINPPIPPITGITNICAGSSTTICTSPAFTNYLWNIGTVTPCITVNTAGVYTVTVTDANGCTGTNSTVVTVNPNPAPLITGDSILCQSNSLNAGSGYAAYLWSTSAVTQTVNISSIGIYTVTVTNLYGCTGSDVFIVSAIPFILSSSGPTAICSGDSVMLTAIPLMVSYQWYRNYNIIQGATSENLWIKNAGKYSCHAIDTTGCHASSNFRRVSIICFPPLPAIERIENSELDRAGIIISPNPANFRANVILNFPVNEWANVQLMDVSGRIVNEFLIAENTTEFSFENYQSGIFLLQIVYKSGYKLQQKILFY